MADLSLESPTTFRLVAAATATVASLALVALGVQLGTDGIGSIGPDRNPASATASPAAAVVDLSRPRPIATNLTDTLFSLIPPAPVVAASTGGSTTPPAGGPAVAPTPAPAPAPAPAPEPTPAPLPPAPPLPAPLPDTSPILAPLEPVVGPVTEGVDTLAAATEPQSGQVAPANEPAALVPTLTDLLGL